MNDGYYLIIMCNKFLRGTEYRLRDYDIILRGNPFESKMAASIDPVDAVSSKYPCTRCQHVGRRPRAVGYGCRGSIAARA